MKGLIVFLSLLILAFSCKKSDTNNLNELSGSWRMILVKDIVTGGEIIKPSTIIGDVDITFTPVTITSGNINGKTPTNILSADYTIGGNSTIEIPAVSATKVMETTWGIQFLNNVTTSHHYYFETNDRLNIKTTNKILTFQRL